MRKLILVFLLIGCDEADKRPHREAVIGGCPGSTYMYAVGLGGPKDKRPSKPFATTEAALQRIKQDGCYVQEHQPDTSNAVLACCPRVR